MNMFRSGDSGRTWRMAVLAVAALAALVLFAALILPGVTLESEPAMLECSLELHEHGAGCFDAEGNVICGYADFVVHTHGADCYDAAGRLICPLPEIAEHEHTAGCYAEHEVLACEYAGDGGEAGAEHVHGESCYISEPVCGIEAGAVHTHGESCYDSAAGPELICTLAEGAGHSHGPECYETVLSCSEEHEHGEGCYTETLICTLAEGAGHTHTAECYASPAGAVPVCGLEEGVPHVHTEDCCGEPVLACGYEQGDAPPEPVHEHGPECYETVRELICGRQEIILHTHTIEGGCFDPVTGALICERLEVREHVHDGSCLPPSPSR